MNKKVLVLQLRPEDAPANREFEDVLEFGKLNQEEVQRLRLSKQCLEKDSLGNEIYTWTYTGLATNIDINKYSCVFIGGGPQNISDKEEEKTEDQKKLEKDVFAIVDQALDLDFPVLASCLGVGLLTKAKNGKLSDKYKEEVAVIDVHITDEGKKDPILKGVESPFRALVGHKESCEELGEDTLLLGKGDNCPNQLFKAGKNFYASQFHPENDIRNIIIKVETYDGMGYFPPGEGQKIIERFKTEDFRPVNKIVTNFFDMFHRGE